MVTLVLLTVTVAIGVANAQRWHSKRIPRFVINGVHRNASLLSVAFLAVHVLTTVLDNYTAIGLVSAFVPFTGSYRPFWIGMGALSLDLLLAVMVTSLMRKRVGYRAWRAVHWLAYASWPVALLHSIGAGTDSGTLWMLAIVGSCLLVVLLAVWSRLGGAALPSAEAGSRDRRWRAATAGARGRTPTARRESLPRSPTRPVHADLRTR